jgi:thioredoxin-related protein
MMMRYLAPALALALLLLPSAGTAQSERSSAPKSVRWVPLELGMERAAESGRYVFVSVYTDWCGYCRRLNNVTLRAEPVLKELGKNYESVMINAESERPVVWKGQSTTFRELSGIIWGVTGYPTLLFINPKGEIIGRYASYADPELMLQLLTYVSSGARERKLTFEEFIEEQG